MNHNLKSRHLIFIFIIMGFSAMMTQVVTLRELIIVFTGNELILGIILGLWLLWTAVGSGLISRLIPRLKHPLHTLIFCQLIIIILLPITLVFIRISKQIFFLPIGELAPPYFIFIIPALAFAPICTLFGFLYALGCKLFSQAETEFSSVAGRVYLFEGIGAGMAGFIASAIFFRYLENFQIVTIICILNLFVAFFLLIAIKKKLVFLWILAIPLFAMLILIFFPRIDRFSNHKAWGALQLLHSKNSIYGNITITRLGESTSFYDNGALMFTNPDVMSAEESVHFALLEHPSPQTVLLIGGDPAGSLPQILHHPSIKQVDFVTLNPATIQFARNTIPKLAELLQDKRIHVWHKDGRLFLKQQDIKYDVIIINLPEPQTTMINRFYTVEFYQMARQKLNRHGMLSFSLPSSENVLSYEQQLFLSCLFHTMNSVFEDIVLIPGNSIHFVGCTSREILTRNPQILVERLIQRKLPTKYVREYYIPFRMSEERMEFINNQIQRTRATVINRDFQPIGYFYNTILWMSSFNLNSHRFLTIIKKGGLYFLFLTVILIFLVELNRFVKKKTNIRQVVSMTIFGIGFTSISLEVLIILGFQAIYGYAYYQLTLIITGFMIGLTIGSWFGIGSLRSNHAIFSRFLLVQFLSVLYPVMTLISLLLLSKIILSGILIQVVFLVLIFGAGFIGGFQFPVANHLILREHEHVEIIGGTLYAWDLAGSVVGAILTSTLLIPIMGIRNASIMFSILNLLIFFMLVLKRDSTRTKSI